MECEYSPVHQHVSGKTYMAKLNLSNPSVTQSFTAYLHPEIDFLIEITLTSHCHRFYHFAVNHNESRLVCTKSRRFKSSSNCFKLKLLTPDIILYDFILEIG